MSNVIEFLEQMGRDAHLRHGTGADIEAALVQAGIQPDVRAALLGSDQRLLESLVGATHPICCLIHPPEEEEEREDEHEEEGGDESEEKEGEEDDEAEE
jgi:hypothetical protein